MFLISRQCRHLKEGKRGILLRLIFKNQLCQLRLLYCSIDRWIFVIHYIKDYLYIKLGFLKWKILHINTYHFIIVLLILTRS